MKDTPVACSLSAEDFRQRLAAIAALNRDALVSASRGDLTLELVYKALAVHRVRDLVRQEAACCAFLSFDIDESADAVRVHVTAPVDARIAAETLFEQFSATTVGAAQVCCV